MAEYLEGLIAESLPKNLADLGDKKRISALFGFRLKLLTLASEDPILLEEIFKERARIANLFLEFGAEGRAELLDTFQNAEQAEDLLKDFKGKKRKRPEAPDYKIGIITFGPELSDTQFSSIVRHKLLQTQGELDKKVSNPRPMNMLELLRLKRRDGRRIVITALRDQKLDTQLQYMTYIRPDLSEQIYLLQWNDNKPVLEKYRSNSALLSNPQQEAAKFMAEFVSCRPRAEQIFTGVIRSVINDTAFSVEILPGIEGLVYIPNDDPAYLQDLSIEKGQLVTVKVMKIDRNGCISLSVSEAAKDISEKKAKPVFQLDDHGLKLLEGKL
ncbi:MAG: hypothetical protein PHU71_02740 [Candidatus Gracilibacteria bacterium]|nr:hypothetical protein [Candidatus Gracilibacteria bacterium]